MSSDLIVARQSTANAAPRFAYMLLTHKEPERVQDLALRVLELSRGGEVVIHHDLAATTPPWPGQPPARVHTVDRGRVLWGDWSIVEATLRMVRYAIDDLDADWFVLISGEHRPVVDLEEWEKTIHASGVDALAPADALPRRLRFGRANEGPNSFLARCTHRWRSLDEPPYGLTHRALCACLKVASYTQPICSVEYSHRRRAWFFGTPRRRGPLRDWTFYKGDQWIAFNRRAAQTILGTDPRGNRVVPTRAHPRRNVLPDRPAS